MTSVLSSIGPLTSKIHLYPYFAYPLLEKRLNDFFARKDVPLHALRLYAKLLYCVKIYADTDYHDLPSREEAIARGWEEIQVAFSARSEQFLSHLIWQIWSALPEDLIDNFKDTITLGLREAENNTAYYAERLYTSDTRAVPIMFKGATFEHINVVPHRGPRAREWAISRGVNPDEFERQLHHYEEYDRKTFFREMNSDKEEVEEPATNVLTRKGIFIVINGGKE